MLLERRKYPYSRTNENVPNVTGERLRVRVVRVGGATRHRYFCSNADSGFFAERIHSPLLKTPHSLTFDATDCIDSSASGPPTLKFDLSSGNSSKDVS